MNKWQKIGIAVGLGSISLATIHVLNRIIFKASVMNSVTDINTRHAYRWKFGNVSYTKTGKGSPVLLIHDLKNTSSSYEWKSIVKELSKTRTVYTIDLLGCGYSDKPNITYTAYLYVQLLNDFITGVIGRRTDVIVTGDSCPLAIMACYNSNSLFDKIIMINPESITEATKIPGKRSNVFRMLMNSPIIGTFIYNISMSHANIRKNFKNDIFYNYENISNDIMKAYHENAHLSGASAKYLYTSTKCRYTTSSIGRAVSEINNLIYIIGGKSEKNIKDTIQEYTMINPAIESALLSDCRHLPQIEHPEKLLYQLSIYL